MQSAGNLDGHMPLAPRYAMIEYRKEDRHALRALLLAVDSGPRRVRPARPRGGGRPVYRRGKAPRRHGEAGTSARKPKREASALRAALPQGGWAPDRPHGEHLALSWRAPWSGAEKRSRPALAPSISPSPPPSPPPTPFTQSSHPPP